MAIVLDLKAKILKHDLYRKDSRENIVKMKGPFRRLFNQFP